MKSETFDELRRPPVPPKDSWNSWLELMRLLLDVLDFEVEGAILEKVIGVSCCCCSRVGQPTVFLIVLVNNEKFGRANRLLHSD